jgi:hypothetical protein
LDCELSVFPCFGGFGVFFFAVWTLNHYNHKLCFCMCWFNTFYGLAGWGKLFMVFWIMNQ